MPVWKGVVIQVGSPERFQILRHEKQKSCFSQEAGSEVFLPDNYCNVVTELYVCDVYINNMYIYIQYTYIYIHNMDIHTYTSSTAQGGGGRFRIGNL